MTTRSFSFRCLGPERFHPESVISGRTTADVDRYMASKRAFNLGRAAELDLLRGAFAKPADAELCEQCRSPTRHQMATLVDSGRSRADNDVIPSVARFTPPLRATTKWPCKFGRVRAGRPPPYAPPDDHPLCVLCVTGQKDGKQGELNQSKVTIACMLWVPAVNNAGTWGRWAFIEITDPWNAQNTIRASLGSSAAAGTGA